MQDPLNIEIDLQGVDTSLPLIPEDAPVRLQVVESTIGLNREKSGNNWDLTLATVDPITAVDGREIKPGFKLFKSTALQPKADSKDPEAFRRALGEVIDAVFGTNKNNRPKFNNALVAEAVGKTCVGTIENSEWQGTTSSKIRRLKAESQAGL